MNKKGAIPIIVWILGALLVIYLVFPSIFQGIGTPTTPPSGGDCPSDKKVDTILTFKDELATSERQVNASWYIFNGDGSLYKSGTASSGTSTAAVSCNENYQMWTYESGAAGYLAKKVDYSSGSDPIKPVTVTLIARGGFTLYGIDDTVNLNGNLTGTAGSTEGMKIKYAVNESNTGSQSAVIVFDTNSSAYGVEDIAMTNADDKGGTYTEITCPGRISPSAADRTLHCFKRDKMALATDGTIVAFASIKFKDTNPVGDLDSLTARIIDWDLYLEPGFSKIDGIKFGAEDDNDADVGEGDTATVDAFYND